MRSGGGPSGGDETDLRSEARRLSNTVTERTYIADAMKQHVVLGMSAALVAGAITVLLHFYGAHDVQGFFLAIAGFPGVVASTHSVEPNDVLLTFINWIFYFSLFEGIAALKRRLSRGKVMRP